MNEYYEQKVQSGLIFTMHHVDPLLPSVSIKPGSILDSPIEMPTGPSYWSRLSCRYRTYEEQRAFLLAGCDDCKLPPLAPHAASAASAAPEPRFIVPEPPAVPGPYVMAEPAVPAPERKAS